MLLEINSDTPEPRKIQRALDVLNQGGVIAYPTDTCYGLGCDLFNKKAIDRLYQIKAMDREHMLSFVCQNLGEVAKYAVVHDRVYRILKQYLPGPYCFILEATREVPRVVQTPRKTVGVRIPNHPVALGLTAALGHPIISSTAAKPRRRSGPRSARNRAGVSRAGLGPRCRRRGHGADHRRGPHRGLPEDRAPGRGGSGALRMTADRGPFAKD